VTSFAITTPVADLQYEMKQTFAGEYVIVKNAYIAYILDGTTLTQITDTDYPSYHSYAVTSITRAGAVATVTTTTTNTLEAGNTVVIAGATQPEYNGTFTIATIVTPGSVFTYAVSGAPAKAFRINSSLSRDARRLPRLNATGSFIAATQSKY